MANIKSAIKRNKTSEERRKQNKSVKSKIGTLRRALTTAIEAGEKDKEQDIYRQYCSALDKAAKKGTIKKNTASRRKSRAAAALSA